MSPFEPKTPPDRAETQTPTPERAPATTSGGVTVIVREDPPPEPSEDDELPQRYPSAIVLPPNQSTKDRDAFIRALQKQHGDFIQDLLRRRNVLEESRKDLRQRVLFILSTYFAATGQAPDNVRGFLFDVVEKEVANHRRRWRPDIEQGADTDVQVSSTPDPEGTAELAEHREKLERYLASLPEEDAELIRYIDLLETTIQETAEKVQRPATTVVRRHARAREKLRQRALESERRGASAAQRKQGK